MLEITIPNAVSVYKQVKHLVGITPTSGRVRIGMTNTDMTLVCENEIDIASIRTALVGSGILTPKATLKETPNPIENKQKQHIYNPSPKESKRKVK